LINQQATLDENIPDYHTLLPELVTSRVIEHRLLQLPWQPQSDNECFRTRIAASSSSSSSGGGGHLSITDSYTARHCIAH